MTSDIDLAKRRDRVIATLLAFKETEVDRYVPDEIRIRLRKLIMDQINDFYAAANSQKEPVPALMVNELLWEKLDKIYEAVTSG